MDTIPEIGINASHTFNVPVSVAIRKATQEDLSKLEWYGQFIHYRDLFKRSYREQQKGNRLLLVAVTNDYPIARLFIQYRGHNKRMANGYSRGYLYSFCVMEMFRGQGIGSQILHVAEGLLAKQNYQLATIAVAKDNPRALQLYIRHGYHTFAEEIGKWEYRDHRGRLRQVQEPCWLLEKHLSSSSSG